MNEYETILRLMAPFGRSLRQRNQPFECDAELLEIGGELWGVSVDEFSPAEDCFPGGDSRQLGRNLAVATLSDLFACGAQPAFFLQALCLPPDSDDDFTDGLARGISETLEAAECHLCGGDLGRADTWRFTGIALGRVPHKRAITRRIGTAGPVELWISGSLGDGNLAAVGALPALSLELRTDVAKWLAEHAVACIDTSGGLWDAMWMLTNINPGLRFELNLACVPLADGVASFCRKAGLPPSVALIGGAGEYELLFAVESASNEQLRAELLRIGAVRIGQALPHHEPGFFATNGACSRYCPAPPCPNPRGNNTREAYFAAVAKAASTLEGAL
jgi:thiamine-monophosphate kinase